MIRAAVLGATGMVGQIFIHLLEQHPWIRTTVVAASEKSSGLTYEKAARWRIPHPIPQDVAALEVVDATPKAAKDVDIVFSALPAELAAKVEEDFAKEGYVVVSTASAHRLEPDVPLLNPEVNHDHLCLIEDQRKRRNWSGAIVTSPNCSTSILTLALKPIYDGFGITRVIVSTMQALSGAGYPGVQSLDIVDNVIPFIKNEEEKMQSEPLKVLGSPTNRAEFKISASCHRVPIIDGHMEAVFVELKHEANAKQVADEMSRFSGEPQKLKLPSAPPKPVIVKSEEDRPQTRLDRMEGKGMSVVVGRLRRDEAIGGIKFIVLGHNTIRGGAGCAILNAEYLKTKNYV